MSRWSQYDDDECRLPEGMKRVAYDADTQRYYFRDNNGTGALWSSASEFGLMVRENEDDAPTSSQSDEHLEEGEGIVVDVPTRSDGYQALSTNMVPTSKPDINAAAYRSLYPFFLLIGIFLLLIWRYILSPGLTAEAACADTDGGTPYFVQPGDTCWDIAQAHGCSYDVFDAMNKDRVNCAKLIPGSSVCLPRPNLPPLHASKSAGIPQETAASLS